MHNESTIPELLINRAARSPNQVAYWSQNDQAHWQPITWEEFYRQVTFLSKQLKDLGFTRQQVIGIMAPTGYEWEVVHHALLAVGCIVVGIDPSETEGLLDTMLKKAKITALIIPPHQFDRFEKTIQTTRLIAWHSNDSDDSTTAISTEWIQLIPPDDYQPDVQPAFATVKPDDIATIIFTSGTTGEPKGIAYQHKQVLCAVDAILQTYPELHEHPCHLACWLPLANLFQRIVNLCAIGSGAQVFFVPHAQKIVDYLPSINPHIFIAVPRFYQKLYQALETKLNKQPPLLRGLLHQCLKNSERPFPLGPCFKWLNRYLFKSFIKLFGANLRYLISGSAPMPFWLLKRYDALGLRVLEAYGMSENVVPIAANRANHYCFGTVGPAMPGNTIQLADDGELLVKGPGVFTGYLGQDSGLNEQGYLASGDYAEIDAQGFIRLTGRKSEVFKTSTGRKIAPAAIEALLQQIPNIDHVVVFGANQKYLVALLTVPDQNKNQTDDAINYVGQLQAQLAQHMSISKLKDYQRPVGFIIRFGCLSVEHNELTGNLKLRRDIIKKRYRIYLEQLYHALDNPQSPIHQAPQITDATTILVKA